MPAGACPGCRSRSGRSLDLKAGLPDAISKSKVPPLTIAAWLRMLPRSGLPSRDVRRTKTVSGLFPLASMVNVTPPGTCTTVRGKSGLPKVYSGFPGQTGIEAQGAQHEPGGHGASVFDQAGDVLGCVPTVLPGSAFHVGAALGKRLKGGKPGAILVLAAKELHLRVEDMAPVLGALHKSVVIVLSAQCLRNLGDAEISVGRVHRLGRGLGYTIRGNLLQLEIVLQAGPPISLGGITGNGGVGAHKISSNAFPAVNLYQDRLIGQMRAPQFQVVGAKNEASVRNEREWLGDQRCNRRLEVCLRALEWSDSRMLTGWSIP